MRNKKVCYSDCKVCANKKECDERSKILLENINKEAKKRGYLKSSKVIDISESKK